MEKKSTLKPKSRIIQNRTGLENQINTFFDENIVWHPLSSMLLKDLYDVYVFSFKLSTVASRLSFQILFEELLEIKAKKKGYYYEKTKSAKGICFKGLGLQNSNTNDPQKLIDELKTKILELENNYV